MKFRVSVRPPTGPEFEAVVDEDNNWTISGKPNRELSSILASWANLELLRSGEPGYLDARMKYADALVAALPGSIVLSKPPGNNIVDNRTQF